MAHDIYVGKGCPSCETPVLWTGDMALDLCVRKWY